MSLYGNYIAKIISSVSCFFHDHAQKFQHLNPISELFRAGKIKRQISGISRTCGNHDI